jgi:hypothetical protein
VKYCNIGLRVSVRELRDSGELAMQGKDRQTPSNYVFHENLMMIALRIVDKFAKGVLDAIFAQSLFFTRFRRAVN